MTPIHFILHIPRTGGSFLAEILKQSDKILYFRNNKYSELLDFYKENKNSKKPIVLQGHAIMGLHRSIGCLPNYYTLFREPIEREVSAYNYIKTNSSHVLRQNANDMSIIDFANKYWPFDIQVRHILGERDIFNESISEDHLDLVKWELKNKFAFFGLREYYQLSVKIIFDKIGIPFLNFQEYKSSYTELSDPVILDFLKNRNKLDSLLWDWVKSKIKIKFKKVL